MWGELRMRQSDTSVHKRLLLSLHKLFNRKAKGKKPYTIDGKPLPGKLKLEFSQASDIKRLNHVFSPEIKTKIDPNGYVVKRDNSVLEKTLSRGGGTFLSDKQGELYTLTLGYPLHRPKNKSLRHDFTEIGTTMARMGGYNSAQLVVCAMVLKEWWDNDPNDLIIAEIDPANGASIHTYQDKMGWQAIKDQSTEDELFILCNQIIAPEDQGNPTIWFEASNVNTLSKSASIILDTMKQGGLLNKKTGHILKVDFSELDKVGLNKQVLQSISQKQFTKIKSLRPGFQ
jgi:hypothetical protein